VYVDANCVIYSVEKVPPYHTLLEPLWHTVAKGELIALSSELTVCETLVRPIRDRNRELETAFRRFLIGTREFRLVPISLATLEHAARIRAETGLKTPDAIHAATALEVGAALLLTSDSALRRVPGLAVSFLPELVGGS
jgi:predicted nucleic acid-binding protein